MTAMAASPTPFHTRRLIRRAVQALGRGDETQARTLMQEALQSAPHAFGALVQGGLLHLDLHEPQIALDYFTQARSLDPTNEVVDLFAGIACLDLDEGERAREHFRAVVLKQPGNLLARGFLALLTLREGKIELGLRILKKAGLESSPRLTGRLLVVVEQLILGHKQDTQAGPKPATPREDDASTCLPAGASDPPTPPNPGPLERFWNKHMLAPTLLGRAEQALYANQCTQAVALATQARTFSTDLSRSGYILGAALLGTQQFEAATQLLEETLQERGESPELLYALGCCHYEQGHLEVARTHLERMLTLFAKDAAAEYLLGQIALEHKDPLKARHHFERAASLDFLVIRSRLQHLEELAPSIKSKGYTCPGTYDDEGSEESDLEPS